MSIDILIIALGLGVAIGWLWARLSSAKYAAKLPKPYLEGLNLLLSEQPDKAIDIFIKLLAADNDNVETHFALGQLFRRRGEVDRAIRIHQHILARPQLDKSHRQLALLALGTDYLHAGVFDRAERVFQELSRSDSYRVESLQKLLHIYEQEHEWEKAIAVAETLIKFTQDPVACRVAHYYCELAQSPAHKANQQQREQLLKKAIAIYKTSARAALLLGDLYYQQEAYKQAIKQYLRLEELASPWLSEAYVGLQKTYMALGQAEKFYHLLQRRILQSSERMAVNLLADHINQSEGQIAASEFLLNQAKMHPQWIYIQKILDWRVQRDNAADVELKTLSELMGILGQHSIRYRCQHCGFSSHELHWFCPGCQHWDSIVPI